METAKPTDTADAAKKEKTAPTSPVRNIPKAPPGIGAPNPQKLEADDKEADVAAEGNDAGGNAAGDSVRQSLANRLSQGSGQRNNYNRRSANDPFSMWGYNGNSAMNAYYYNYMNFAYSPQARLAASNANLQLALENYWAQMQATNAYFMPQFSPKAYEDQSSKKKRVKISLQSSLNQQKDKDKAKQKNQARTKLGNATTIMLRNIPNRYSREMLLEEFKHCGVMKTIDFFYLPMDIQNGCNIGYCFVNLTSTKAAEKFVKQFEDAKLDQVKSEKTCRISVANVQGKEANVEHYRNAAVITMEEDYHPMLFQNGRQIPFPTAVKPSDTRKARGAKGNRSNRTSDQEVTTSKKKKKNKDAPTDTSKQGAGQAEKADASEQVAAKKKARKQTATAKKARSKATKDSSAEEATPAIPLQ